MIQTKLLQHQALFMSAPLKYPDIRYFFMCAGYAAGKTSTLVMSTLFWVDKLQGKKDREGTNPRILVGSKNITFLAKTWTDNFIGRLQASETPYTFDKAKNIIHIGNVEILLVGLENPDQIYGYSVFCFEENTPILTSKGNVAIKDIKVGDLVLTTKGFKRVKNIFNNGVRPCIEVNVQGRKVLCTSDHRFLDIFDRECKASDLTYLDTLVTIDTKEYCKCQRLLGKIERSQKLLTSMVSDTTDTQKVNLTESGATSLVQTRIRNVVSLLCTEICGFITMVQSQRDIAYTIKTETISTTVLKISFLLRSLNTQKNIGVCNQKRNANRLLRQLKRLHKDVASYGKKTGKECYRNSTNDQSYCTSVSVQSVEKLLSQKLLSLCTALKNVQNLQIMQSKENLTKPSTESKGLVSSVARHSLAINTLLLKPAHLTAKTSNAVGQYTVYDIEVEDVHEYFANGIRVHNCAILDEIDELPANVAMEAIRSINDRVRQPIDDMRQPFIQVASSAQGLKGLYQTIRHFQTHNISYFLLRARTRDNYYLGEDYIRNIYSIYNEKEVRCFLEGEFLAVDSGLVFPDYNPAENDLEYDMYDTLDDDAVVYIANDFNSFFCAAVAFTVIDNAMIILKDYKVPDFRRAPEVYRYDFPTQTIIWIPDMTFKEHFWEYRKELRSNNIKLALRAANPLIQDRVFATNKLFHVKRLFVCPICKETKTALLTHQIDRKTGMPTKAGESSPDHISDCIGYAVHYILSWRPEFKDVYEVTLERLERGRKRNKGVLVDLQQSVS